MDFLVVSEKLQRHVIYTYYLNKQFINLLYPLVQFGKVYSAMERNSIEDVWSDQNNIPLYYLINPDEIPTVVYFFKTNYYIESRKNSYVFKIDYTLIKNENEIFNKELVEYVFKPDRVKRLGCWEYLDSL